MRLRTKTMSKVIMPESEYESRQTQQWLNGQAHGVEQIAEWLNVKAGEAYGKGQDQEAKTLRAMAKLVLTDRLPVYCRAAEIHRREYIDPLGVIETSEEEGEDSE